MNYKWIGSVLIVLGCGGFGFSLAARHRLEEASLRQLLRALDFMTCELQFRLTPLPELCRQTGKECRGLIRQVFLQLSQALEAKAAPDVSSCMESVLLSLSDIPSRTAENLSFLGSVLGRFDLDGQINGLEAVRTSCRKALETMSDNRDARLRSYQTLGLCGGAALAIILI